MIPPIDFIFSFFNIIQLIKKKKQDRLNIEEDLNAILGFPALIMQFLLLIKVIRLHQANQRRIKSVQVHRLLKFLNGYRLVVSKFYEAFLLLMTLSMQIHFEMINIIWFFSQM